MPQKRKETAPTEAPSTKRRGRPSNASQLVPLVARGPVVPPLTACGTVFTVGRGDMGQLGLGEDVMERKRAALVEKIKDVEVVQVVCGGMHTVALTSDSKVYTWGCNDEGALGRLTSGAEDEEEFVPMLVEKMAGQRVLRVSGGDSHTAALVEDGSVFAWGAYRDSSGQIGLTSAQLSDKGQVSKIFPTEEASGKMAVQVASGNNHTVILTSTGEVYSCGVGEQGQLGRLKECFGNRGGRRGLDLFLRPQRVHVRRKENFVSIACGSFTTFAITAEGVVYSWGLNNYGQLASGDTDDKFNATKNAPLTEMCAGNTISIASGQHHSVFADTQGRVFASGRSEYGRLGLGENATETNLPVLVSDQLSSTSIASGENVSFTVTTDGRAFAWGEGTNLQLAIGEEEEDLWVPTLIKSKNINPETDEVIEVSSGGQHSAFLVRKRQNTTIEY